MYTAVYVVDAQEYDPAEWPRPSDLRVHQQGGQMVVLEPNVPLMSVTRAVRDRSAAERGETNPKPILLIRQDEGTDVYSTLAWVVSVVLA